MILRAGETAHSTPFDALQTKGYASASAPHTVSLNLSPEWGASARCLGASSVRLFSREESSSDEESDQDHKLWTKESDAEQSDEEHDESVKAPKDLSEQEEELKKKKEEIKVEEDDEEHDKPSPLPASNDCKTLPDSLAQDKDGQDTSGRDHQPILSDNPRKIKKSKKTPTRKSDAKTLMAGAGPGHGFRMCSGCHVIHHYRQKCKSDGDEIVATPTRKSDAKTLIGALPTRCTLERQ
jgi:hypothetical protein